ncbi:MAG: hypothetical protein LBG70_00020 [Bifidobacteriaceae bacterium]|jgi:hypothetical protein|nr:hypothetical protein [Bifidobacteriaceae bacterium]
MSRPTDWQDADQPADPTPGEPSGVLALARSYQEVAQAAQAAGQLALRVRSRLADETAKDDPLLAETWLAQLEGFPQDIERAAESFLLAEQALTTWAARLAVHQQQADENLRRARQAAEQLRQTSSAAADENTQVETRSRLAAARRLVQEAKEAYEADARLAVVQVEQATRAAIPAYDWWQEVMHGEVWQAVNRIAQAATAVLAVLAIPPATGASLIESALASVMAAHDLSQSDSQLSTPELFGLLARAVTPNAGTPELAQRLVTQPDQAVAIRRPLDPPE